MGVRKTKAVKAGGGKDKRAKLTAWSHSRKNDYDQCPFKAYCKHILKIREPPNEAMARGLEIHEKGEAYLKGNIKRLPAEYKHFAAELKELRLDPTMFAERHFGVDKNWTPCEFFDKGAWLRGKMDAGCHVSTKQVETLKLIDFKTGKVRENYDQLDQYAAIGIAHYPTVDAIETELWFLDHGVIVDKTFTAGEALKRQRILAGQVKGMLNDTTYLKKPNFRCRWCHYRKDGGGQCPHG